MVLPAFAAQCMCQVPAINQYLLQMPKLGNKPATRCCCSCRQTGQTHEPMDRQTNGRTPDRYIDPAPHTMRAVPNTQLNLLSCTTNRFTNVATSNCLAMVLRHVTGSTAELSEVSALSLALTFLLLLLAPAFVETPASLIHQALQVYPAVNSGHVSVYRNVSR